MKITWAFSLFFLLQLFSYSQSIRKVDLEKLMNPELYDLSLDKVEKLFGLKENLRPRGVRRFASQK